MLNDMVMIQTGKVVNGRIVVSEGAELQEGAVVTIVSREPDETFKLTPELEAELREALDDVRRGEVAGIDALHEQLDALRPRRR